MPALAAMEHSASLTRASEASSADDEITLVVAAQRDPRAFTHLYLRYVDPVYRYCHRRLGAREAAEDATSLIFAKALAALPRYRSGNASFRSWLFAIAHNVVVDAHRAAVVTRTLDAVVDRAGRDPGPEAIVLAAEERRTLDGLLAALAPDQRRVLELRLAGLTTAEIADALGRNPSAIRAVQFRAAKRLRDLLGRDVEAEDNRDA